MLLRFISVVTRYFTMVYFSTPEAQHLFLLPRVFPRAPPTPSRSLLGKIERDCGHKFPSVVVRLLPIEQPDAHLIRFRGSFDGRVPSQARSA